MAAPVTVLGLGMSPVDLTPAARERLAGADVLAGGRRLLEYFPGHPAEKVVLDRQVAATLRDLAARLGSRRLVILASGDPNFYGVGPLAVEIFGPERVEIFPNLTAVQAAAARLKVAWQDAWVVSLHGRSSREFSRALGEAGKIFVYTDPENTPAVIARELLARGLAGARMAVVENLGQPGERLEWYDPAEAAGRTFAALNVVYVERPPAPAALHLGLPEEELAHEAGLVTKLEVRAVALALLRLLPGHILWDVGAGSGSVGLEAGRVAPGLEVYAVERHPKRLAQITANRERFGAVWLLPVLGEAPEILGGLPDPDRVFVGGGGEARGAILTTAVRRLKRGGRLVAAATLLSSLETARQVLAQEGLRPEVVQVQVSRSRPLAGDTYLQAANPVWLIAGSREEG